MNTGLENGNDNTAYGIYKYKFVCVFWFVNLISEIISFLLNGSYE